MTAPSADYAALDLPLLSRGKVRDTYVLGPARLLMVASDRISTYDAVHPTPIPDKGKVLTAMSVFWFEQTEHIVANHLVSAAAHTDAAIPQDLRGRALVVKRLEMFPIECVVRGYLAGSGWVDYKSTGSVCGHELPAGLTESQELSEPIFTPATKAETGDHDENVSEAQAAEILGSEETLQQLKTKTLAVYTHARDYARERGIIVADTKLEFGRDPQTGEIVLADEVLTPDSSRFWPADEYAPGGAQPSFDKQFVRDWAASTGWDKTPPAPAIPDEIAAATRARYIEAYERLTGRSFDDWLAAHAPSG